MLTKILFLDRDGLINEKPKEHEHIININDFKLLPKVKEAIELAYAQNYIIIVITNQRLVPSSICEQMNDYLKKLIPEIRAIYFCNHDYNSCTCRKPEIGMFKMAEWDLNYLGIEIDKENSYMIGDSITDIIAGEKFGIKTILTNDLYKAVKEII